MGLKNFLKNYLRNKVINAGGSGKVTGGDYLNYGVTWLTADDIGTKMVFGRSGKEPYYFDKNDVVEFTTLETGTKWSDGTNVYVGNKYKVKFKDGKASIINIVANDTSRVEAMFIL